MSLGKSEGIVTVVVGVDPETVGPTVGVDCSTMIVVGIQDWVGTVRVVASTVETETGVDGASATEVSLGRTGATVEDGSSTRSLVFVGTELV